ncbi:hypothetical protein [Rheinheimera sp.]|uniref:hypothetical protein n=1 Tax=Rheinheimera sp. TaxID=1869214 RepID=UPI0027B9BA9B|nr:hypothetical protein [Rheinheimera sp.]
MNYEIKLPILSDLDGYKPLIYIKPSSPKKQKEALEKMAVYFRREFKYDYVQYSKENHGSDCTGIIFTETAMDLVKNENHFPNRVIGGACFRQKSTGEYFLDWVWFHPFARNRKILKRHWPELKQKFPNFTLTKPLSAHMEAFVKKHK